METHPVKNANRQLVTCLSACILLTMFLVPLVGCRESDDAEYALGEIDSTYDAEWNERNAEIYRYLFSQLEEPPSDRIYFITTTPGAQWTDSGGWDVIPAEELAQFPAASKYRPADEAFMKGSDVLVKARMPRPGCTGFLSNVGFPTRKLRSKRCVVLQSGGRGRGGHLRKSRRQMAHQETWPGMGIVN
ncbi:MAG: hypothetical protein H6824_04250 [Planctomycetaceae bacterium]|nr:hypothetical protein [Planctomycetaceae bacterium]